MKTGTWTQPNRNSLPCSASFNTNAFSYSHTFIAEGNTYIFDAQRISWANPFDSYSFLYQGFNNATVPATCGELLGGADTGDVRPLTYQGLVVGAPYTFIVSSYSGTATGDFAIYA